LRVALVNTNRITPPVAPIGLDYVAEALCAAGHEADILDLCWEERWEPAIARFLGSGEYGLIGVTVRNTDDCSFATRESFLPTLSSMVECIRKHTGAPIVLGGVFRAAWRATGRGTISRGLSCAATENGGGTLAPPAR
jgi:hypothetical protein